MDCGVTGHERLEIFSNESFVITAIDSFSGWYGQIHQFLSVFICSFGILANLIHITILTRHSMKRSTVNRLLALMACCDIVKMFTYLVYLIRFNMTAQDFGDWFMDYNGVVRRGYGFPWILFLLTHIMLSIDLHATSLYLSVFTAFIRFQAINQLQSRFMQPQIAWKIFVVVAGFVAFLCVPTFLVHEVYKDESGSLYTVGLPRTDERSCKMFMFNLWVTGIFFKVLPCCLLILFTILLLCKLHQNQRKHEKIVSKDSAASRSVRSDRTTLLLVLLLVVFIFTELPQGFLAILNGLYPSEVHMHLYTPLGEVLDLLSLLNGNACFILYPLISSQYRESFRMMVARLRQDFDQISRPQSQASSSHRTVKYQSVRMKPKGDATTTKLGFGSIAESNNSQGSKTPSPPQNAKIIEYVETCKAVQL